MSASTVDTVTMDAGKRAEVDAVLGDDGLVVPLSDLASIDAVPGQRVHVTVTARRRRKNIRGALAGKVRPITREEIKESSREAWGEWAQ